VDKKNSGANTGAKQRMIRQDANGLVSFAGFCMGARNGLKCLR
jgi:hypothetical protein